MGSFFVCFEWRAGLVRHHGKYKSVGPLPIPTSTLQLFRPSIVGTKVSYVPG
jgi:hypothetical protein